MKKVGSGRNKEELMQYKNFAMVKGLRVEVKKREGSWECQV